jgi:N-formylglutamate deformylase
MSENPFSLRAGDAPLILSLPHVGTQLPDELRDLYVPRALALEDTDWHLERLYDFVRGLNVTVIAARVSRYVIDLNRPSDNAPMYPGAANTELCPTRFFTGDALYQPSMAPDANEIERRRLRYWQPYHDALDAQLKRIRSQHGYALLWDGHSIRSEIPWLFDGTLPDMNLGTVNGESCDVVLRTQLTNALRQQREITHVVDARFKGGFITRHYGRPDQHIHAVQMEMCQSLYMNESAPFNYIESRAERVQPILQHLIETALHWRPHDGS